MNRILPLFCLVSSLIAGTAFAQGVSSPSATSGSAAATTGSTYLVPRSSPGIPGSSTPSGDVATLAIPAATRARADTAHATWLAQGGAEFYPQYAYAGGAPVLMLMVPKNEPPSALARRRMAMVQACAFMLADGAFDRSVVCIATYDPKDRLSMATQNTTVTRDAFNAAAHKAGNSSDLSVALNSVYHGGRAVEQICSDLGLQ